MYNIELMIFLFFMNNMFLISALKSLVSFRLIKSTEIRQKIRRSDVLSKMSMSSENISFSLSGDDEYSFKGSSDYLRRC